LVVYIICFNDARSNMYQTPATSDVKADKLKSDV
jgi:hypothetical protein